MTRFPNLSSAAVRLRQHRGALLLVFGASLLFARLASEMREGEVDGIDAAITRYVVSCRGPVVDSLMRALTTIGGEIVMTSLAITAVVALLASRRRQDAAFLSVASGGAMLLNLALKFAFHRP